MRYLTILFVLGLLLMPLAIAESTDDDQKPGFFTRLRTWLSGDSTPEIPQENTAQSGRFNVVEDPGTGDESPAESSGTAPGGQASGGSSGRPVESVIVRPLPAPDYCHECSVVVCEDNRGEFICNERPDRCKLNYKNCRQIECRDDTKPPECREDSECAQIVCVKAPCPQNVCRDGRCVLDDDEGYCGDGICQEDEEGCLPCPPCANGADSCACPAVCMYKCSKDCGPDVGRYCIYDGHKYKPGESFKSGDGCNSCTCGESGLVACTLEVCKQPVVCEHDGKKYKPGDSFKSADGCNSCTCGEGGLVACTLMACEDRECKTWEDCDQSCNDTPTGVRSDAMCVRNECVDGYCAR